MRPLAPNTPVEVPDLMCPECAGPVEISIEAWGPEDGEPHEFRVECANDDDAFDDGEQCVECDGSGGYGIDESDEDGTCDICGGSGSVSGHRYFQSDWQEIRDQAEAWAKAQGFRVSEASR